MVVWLGGTQVQEEVGEEEARLALREVEHMEPAAEFQQDQVAWGEKAQTPVERRHEPSDPDEPEIDLSSAWLLSSLTRMEQLDSELREEERTCFLPRWELRFFCSRFVFSCSETKGHVQLGT